MNVAAGEIFLRKAHHTLFSLIVSKIFGSSPVFFLFDGEIYKIQKLIVSEMEFECFSHLLPKITARPC
jgi:hypothetical protein